MTVPDYVANVPSTPAIHNEPPRNYQWEGLSQDQVAGLRSRLIESLVQVVVQAITGLFIPGGGTGGALSQLTSWAADIPILGDIVGAITGIFGGNNTDLSNWFTDLIGLLGNPLGLGTGTPSATPTIPLLGPLINGLFGDNQDGTSFLSDIVNGLTGNDDGTASFDNIVDHNTGIAIFNPLDIFSNVQTVLNSVVNGLLGFSSDNWGQTDAAQALAVTAATLTSTASSVAVVQTPGTAASDDFERVSSTSLGTGWSQTVVSGNAGSRVATPNGHDASLDSNVITRILCRYTGTNPTSTTDYQTITQVMSSAPNSAFWLAGSNALRGRVSSDEQSYIIFEYDGSGYWYLSRAVGGVETEMRSGQMTVPGPGASVVLILGDKVNSLPRKYSVKVGANYIINNFAETGTASLIGASNHGYGTMLNAGGAAQAGRINYWSGQDT